MDSARKSHLGSISAAPVPLLIKGSAFERLADSTHWGAPGLQKGHIRRHLSGLASLTTRVAQDGDGQRKVLLLGGTCDAA